MSLTPEQICVWKVSHLTLFTDFNNPLNGPVTCGY